MPWTIEYTATAQRQLGKLDKQTAKRIVNYMTDRVAGLENPRSTGKVLSGPLGGLWRYRVGDYRIICDIHHNTLRILVVKIGNRREVYRRQS